LLVTRLRDQVDGASEGEDQAKVDLTNWLNFTTFDITGDLAFGESFHALEKGESHYFVETIFQSLKFATVLRPLNAYPVTSVLLHALLRIPGLANARKRLGNYTKKTVTKRLEKKTDRKDFLR
jgi:hypothetical protein